MSDADGNAPDPQIWQAAMQLLERMLDLPDAERLAALDASTPEVRELADQLLQAHRHSSILDSPLPTGLNVTVDTPSLAGRQLGRWLLTERLGEGGMSVVYRARSLQSPVGQSAAVKLLSMAAASEAGRTRFEREIEILVRLRHPGIAPVFDAGVAADGTPWFAMALVEGVDIATWCREQGLSVTQRVDLLLQVCEAVEHAHRHLVIHRDIKPSNVLIDADGHAMLLDFGISRILEEGAAEATSTGTFAFTPRYAAPEQIDGGAITTATDVYGLGSLLHLLLLGSAPQFPADSPDADCIAPATLARRDDHALRKALSGDLGAIVRKALARDPERRHRGAAELAADLRAWREGRPVSARRDSGVYRFRRFIARHKLASALAALLVATIIGGTWISLVQRSSALAAAAQATAAEASARQQLEFLQGLLLTLSPSRDMPAAIPRERLLGAAEEQARTELADAPGELADILATIAAVHAQAGRNRHAIALLEEARELAPPVDGDIDSLVRDARLIVLRMAQKPRAQWQGDIERLSRLETTVSAARPGSSDHLAVLSGLTGALIGAARYDAAAAANARALALCPAAGHRFCTAVGVRQSDILWNAGRIQESIALKDELWQRPELEASMSAEDFATFLQRYAQALEADGRHQDAMALVERILERHARIHDSPTRTSLNTLHYKARLLYQLDRLDDALATLDAAIADAAAVEAEFPGADFDLREMRVRVLRRMGRKDEADAAIRAVLPRMRETLGDDHPKVLTATRHLAARLLEQGKHAEAIEIMRGLIGRMRKTKAADSRQVAQLRLELARLLLGSGDPQGADAEYRAARPAYLAADGGDTADSLVIDAERGLVQAKLGQPEEASRQVLAALSALRDRHADQSQYVTVLIRAIDGKCKGPDHDTCEALRAEGRDVLARDLPSQRRLFGNLRKAVEI